VDNKKYGDELFIYAMALMEDSDNNEDLKNNKKNEEETEIE